MRREFADELFKQMQENEDIFLLVGDLGYKVFDAHFVTFPTRCINTGASEQAMVDIAVGLALRGKTPFCYTITSFFLRAAESIHLYLSKEQLPIYLVGSGRDQDYKEDGVSHDAEQAQRLLADLDITNYYPQDKKQVGQMLGDMLKAKKPAFISLTR